MAALHVYGTPSDVTVPVAHHPGGRHCGRRAYLIEGTHSVATPSDATELVRHWLVPGVGELRVPRPARREVTLEGPRLVVVVRHQALPVDRALVQRVAAVAADRSATGLVFSTRGFSRNAVHAATSGSVLLFGVRSAD